MPVNEHVVSRANATYVSNMLAMIVNYGTELLPPTDGSEISTPMAASSPMRTRRPQPAPQRSME